MLCNTCGQYWLKYREYRPLTARQQGVAKSRSDELAAASSSLLMDSLSSIAPAQSQASEAMMQAVMYLQRDPAPVLALPLPPMPPFATLPPPLSARISSKMFGVDGGSVYSGVPFVTFSTAAAVQVRPGVRW